MLRGAIEENSEKIDWDRYHDSGIHVVASTFKTMLREMPEPLMTYHRYDELMEIMGMPKFCDIFELKFVAVPLMLLIRREICMMLG